MATKKVEQTTQTTTIKSIKKKRMSIEIIGDSPLILNKKALSFEREAVFVQTHPKGTPIPDEINQKLHYNIWEKLITSIEWCDSIPEYDRYEDYTEEMYKNLLETNKPCFKQKAFIGSFIETYISFYRDAIGRPTTDFKRSFRIADYKIPIDFAKSEYSQHLVPNTGVNKLNVVAQHTIFHGWTCTLNVSYCESIFPEKTILEIINTSGEYIGIGTKRSEGFGSYHIGKVTSYVAK